MAIINHITEIIMTIVKLISAASLLLIVGIILSSLIDKWKHRNENRA